MESTSTTTFGGGSPILPNGWFWTYGVMWSSRTLQKWRPFLEANNHLAADTRDGQVTIDKISFKTQWHLFGTSHLGLLWCHFHRPERAEPVSAEEETRILLEGLGIKSTVTIHKRERTGCLSHHVDQSCIYAMLMIISSPGGPNNGTPIPNMYQLGFFKHGRSLYSYRTSFPSYIYMYMSIPEIGTSRSNTS